MKSKETTFEYCSAHDEGGKLMKRTYRISDEERQRRSARMKALHADPEFAAAKSAWMKALNADPEFAAAKSAWMKALHADSGFAAANAARSSARMKARHADPKFNPLAALTKKQRKIYDILRKKCGYDRETALRMAKEKK